MAENTIDNLQIQIFGSVTDAETSINHLIDALKNLNKHLSVDTDASAFTKHIGSLVSGFQHLGTAVEGLDVDKLKAVNKEIKSLSGNLSGLSSVKGVGKLLYNDEQKKQIDQLKDSMKWLKDRKKNLKSILPGTFGVGESTMKEFKATGEWKNIQKLLGGKGRTVTGASDNSGEIRDIAQQWGISNADTDSFDEVVRKMAARISQIDNQIAEMKNRKAEIDRLAGEMMKPKAAQSTLPLADDEIATYGQTVNTVATETEKLTTVGENASMSLQSLADGLMQLEGIDISADQFSGVSSITNLALGLSNTTGEGLTKSLYGLTSGLDRLSTVDFSGIDAEKIMTTATAVNRFGYGSSEKAGSNIVNAANGLTELAKVDVSNVNAQNLIELGNAVGKFGSAGATRAAQNLPALATGMTQLMATLSNAPQVSENTIRLAEAMAQMSQRAAGISNAVNRAGNGLNFFGTSARRIRPHITSLAALFGSLYANFFLLIRAGRLAGKAINYSSQMTEAMNVVDVAFGKSSDKLKDFMQDSIKQFGLGRLAAAQYSSRFQMMAKTMGISSEQIGKANEFISGKIQGNERAYSELGDSVADMSINLTKLSADMASLYNQDYNSVAEDMQSILTGMTKPLRKYGVDISVAGMKAFALKNGLDADIQSMSQAEKALLRYQMVMAQASGSMGDFQKTADTWANSMRTVKQLLQEFARILGEAFIQAFKPALIAFRNFMSNLLTLTQSALNAVGKLLGWKKIDFGGATLTEDMEGYADALDEASGNAKKLKGQLRGIDELNNLTTNPKNSGGGGDDTLGNITGADLWENIKETKEKYESTVKDWFDFGRRIANTIEDSLKNIDWEKIKKSVSTGATNFASFLNGLFKPTMFYAIGGTIAEGINTGLTAAYSFGEEFDFENFGVSVREGIKGFLEKFDWSLLGETINTWVQGFFDFCKGLFGDKKLWQDMFNAAVGLIGSLDIDTIAVIAGTIALANSRTWLRNNLSSALSKTLGTSKISLGELALTAGTCVVTVASVVLVADMIATHALGYNPLTDQAAEPNYSGQYKGKKPQVYNNSGSRAGMPSNVGGNKAIPDRLKNNEKESAELTASGFWTWVQNLEDDGAIGKVMANAMKLSVVYGSWAKDIITSTKNLKIEWETFWDEYTTKITNFCIKNTNRIEKFKKQWEAFWFDIFDFWSDPIGKSGLETALENLYTNGKKVIGNIKDLFKQLITYFTGNTDTKGKSTVGMPDEVKKSLGLDKEKSFIDDVKTVGANIVKGILKGMTDESGNISLKALFDNFVKGLKKIFDIHSPSDKKEIKDIGKDIVLGVINGFDLVDFYTEMTDWWNTNVKPWFTVERWLGIANNIKTAISTKWNETKTQWVINLTNWWTNNVAPWFTLEKWQGIVQNIKNAIVNKWNEAVNWWRTNISSWWTNNVAPWFTLDKWKGIADGIRSGIVAKWNELVLWFAGNVGRILDKAKEILSFANFNAIGKDIRKGIENPFSSAIATMTSLWNKLKTLVSGGLSMTVKINADTSGFNSAMEGMATVTQDAVNIIEGLKTVVEEEKKKTPPKSTKKDPGTYTVLKKSAAGMPTFASGGFPTMGSMFIAGETYGQTEWLGDINGRTGVVGGEEITGIRDAIVNTSNAEMQLLRQQNTLLQGILAKEFGISSDALFNSVRNSANNYQRMNGTPAF